MPNKLKACVNFYNLKDKLAPYFRVPNKGEFQGGVFTIKEDGIDLRFKHRETLYFVLFVKDGIKIDTRYSFKKNRTEYQGNSSLFIKGDTLFSNYKYDAHIDSQDRRSDTKIRGIMTNADIEECVEPIVQLMKLMVSDDLFQSLYRDDGLKRCTNFFNCKEQIDRNFKLPEYSGFHIKNMTINETNIVLNMQYWDASYHILFTKNEINIERNNDGLMIKNNEVIQSVTSTDKPMTKQEIDECIKPIAELIKYLVPIAPKEYDYSTFLKSKDAFFVYRVSKDNLEQKSVPTKDHVDNKGCSIS